MGKRNKPLAVFITIYLLVVIFIPPILGYRSFVFAEPPTEDGWASFYGSYIGGVLGGLGTLIAMYLTLVIQNLDNKKVKKEERKALANDVQLLVNRYIVCIEDYLSSSASASEAENEMKRSFDLLEKNGKNAQLYNLHSMKAQFEFQKWRHEDEIKRNNLREAIETLYTLDAKLRGISKATALINSIKIYGKKAVEAGKRPSGISKISVKEIRAEYNNFRKNYI